MGKVLIIKLGHSETLDAEISRSTSFGDVLRTTVVLHLFKDDHVTWLVDEKAHELVVDNPLIKRPLIYDLTSVLQLQSEQFDMVINFEKGPGVCALADSIRAWKRWGFSFDPLKGEAVCRDGTERVYEICRNIDVKRTHTSTWQKEIIEMVGGKWEEQEYVLGYKPKSKECFDFGLNHSVGNKWPTKAWPMPQWKNLAKILKEAGYSFDWQRGLANLSEYIEWINSCRTIITSDSLGFHLALALKKKVVVIYGPTNPHETFMYGRGASVTPRGFRCMPCLAPVCSNDTFCMESVSPDDVYKAAMKLTAQQEDAPTKRPPGKAAPSTRR